MCSAAKRVVPVVCLFVICVAAFAAQATLSVEARRKVLSDFFTEYWDYQMRTNPLEASARGDKRWNDKLADFSQEFLDKDLLQNKIFLDRLEAIDTSGFPDQEVVRKRILVHDLKTTLEGARFKPWEMAVTQEYGPQIEVPGLFTLLSFESVKDYEDYISRLKALPLLFDQTVIQLRKGIADQLMPRASFSKKSSINAPTSPRRHRMILPSLTPFKNFPKSISDADKTRLPTRPSRDSRRGTACLRPFRAICEPGLRAAWSRGARSVVVTQRRCLLCLSCEGEHDHRPHSRRNSPAGSRAGEGNRGGDERGGNQARLRRLQEFQRCTGHRSESPRPVSPADSGFVQHYVDQMYPKLPELFYRLPKAKLVVLPVEEFKEKDASSASYVLPAEDGSRPGRVMVNTGDFAKRSTLDAESTAYHEGVPGHHMQVALAMETTDLPEFRRNDYYTAYIEGWALYAERLGKEVGFYQDP